MDTVSKRKRSKIMRAVKSRDSKIEIEFRKIIWRTGFRYRKNPRNYFGKPDLASQKRRIVIFIDSCFWHGCKKHFRMPASKRDYWKNKIERNRQRDREVNGYYKKLGWKILRFWEHDLKRKDFGLDIFETPQK